ncbi:MAG: hypothetical protein ABSH22_14885 [Tepidisphaeraceae bacterium]
MNARTIFLSKLMGLFLVVVGLSVLVQGRVMVETADGIMHNRPLLYVLGLVTLACGLAIVLLHNRWTDGLLPVVITILGWLTLIKGLTLLLLPPQALVGLFDSMQVGNLLYVYGAIDLAVGVYLTVAGFMAQSQATGYSTRQLPRPAPKSQVGI